MKLWKWSIERNLEQAPLAPADVLDMSQGQIEAVRDDIVDIKERLAACERGYESMRQKVYRDSKAEPKVNGDSEALVPELVYPTAQTAKITIRTGDPVPA